MSIERLYIDRPVANLALEPGIDYFVAIARYNSRDEAFLRLGKQGLRITNLGRLTQGPFLRPDRMRQPSGLEESSEAQAEWRENGFYAARLSIDGCVAYLRERGPMSAISIGRDENSALSISDTTVSRRHLSISHQPSDQEPPVNHDYFVVQDLGSTNGTLLTTDI